MATATRVHDELGPYHGRGEGAAYALAVVGLIAFLIALLLPG